MTAVGETALYRGQAYEFLRFEPYTRRDGIPSTVIVWRTNCATCGAEFEATTSARLDKFKPRRTCPDHRGTLRVAWRDRVQVTEPAPLQRGQRPFAPIAAYDGPRR